MHHILPDNSGHITLDGQRHGFLQKAHLRMAMVTCVLMLGFIAIAWRLTHLSLIGVYAPGTAAAGQMQTAGITALRGGITDRNGEHIAATLRMPSLYADPALVGNADILARDLSKILPVTATDIKHNLARGGRFVWLYRNLTPKQQQRINDLGYPELGFRDEYRRVYPQGNLLSHLLGYTDSDGNGIAGLEKQYNDLLKEGDVLRTTLDIRVQNILKRTIQQSVTRFQAIGGAGIMMDIKTGEIIAMVSCPISTRIIPQMRRRKNALTAIQPACLKWARPSRYSRLPLPCKTAAPQPTKFLTQRSPCASAAMSFAISMPKNAR